MSKEQSKRKRLGEVVERAEAADLLDSIEGEEVEIAEVTFEVHPGRSRPYYSATIKLTDGRVFYTAAGAVVSVLRDVPKAEYPLWATFKRLPSPKPEMEGALYWTVE